MAKKGFLRRHTTIFLGDGIKRARGAMTTRWQRALGHVESVFMDHACFRLIYSNTYRVAPDLYRASQPSPSQIRQAAALGIRTVLNLRGRRDCASYLMETEACRQQGLTLIDFPIGSREAPKRENLLRAKELFDTIEYPALLHCKSGADRAGFMSVFYLLAHEGLPVEEAMKQLSWRYGHFKQAKTGILDHFFDSYAAYNAKHPIPFMEWVERVYDPAELKATFRSGELADTLVDRVLKRE
ncbi:sulfur transferase domain-containing protein [Azospirillum sp. SYSU D00513]|uniref:fused DSP-PTPase phosphatase/NAD kinase-like protein n=1 Tax=Azospirillum sp. SYSU D00513 TaxID=2812561 RepID=UPI0020005156|nr:sulfur transferase domain-containing protein [Azospirillum sp. SYSU D00513]